MAAKVKLERGAYWLVVHADGKRTKRRFGPTRADKRRAEKAAEEINHRLALGLHEVPRDQPEAIPFDAFARAWLRSEVLLPTERQSGGHLAPGTAESYASHVRVHLVPHFRDGDIRSIDAQAVQAFYRRCVESGTPPSPRTIDMVILTLGQVLGHARSSRLVAANAVREWKEDRRKTGRRRSSVKRKVVRDMVLSFEELERVLTSAQGTPHYALFLFLADTGARFGEAAALRWSDIDLDAGSAQILRSFSSGRHLGPTKTGRERTVELSARLQATLASHRPDLFPDDALVFPNEEGGFIDTNNWRNRVFTRVIRKALGRDHRRIVPHTLRHTFASLHLSRGTNLLWVQQQGGWTSPTVLLDVYSHFIPAELHGFADVLASPDGTIRHQGVQEADGEADQTGRNTSKSAPVRWRARQDSNLRPTDSKSGALSS